LRKDSLADRTFVMPVGSLEFATHMEGKGEELRIVRVLLVRLIGNVHRANELRQIAGTMVTTAAISATACSAC